VTADQVRTFAQAHLGREGMSVIIAGDAQLFADALGKAYPKSARYTIAGLDLDSPTLKPAPK